MNNSNEKQVIKLSQLGQLNEVEAYVRQFSNLVKDLLMTMMGYSNKPISVEGTKQQVQSFIRVLGQEKKYMETYRDYGPDNPRTVKVRARLDKEIKDFERRMGVEWPLR
jgi:hypothetical protein